MPSVAMRKCGIGLDASGPGARVHLGGPRQCLRVDIFPDVRQFSISNGNVEDPIVLERLIRGFDFPRSDAFRANALKPAYLGCRCMLFLPRAVDFFVDPDGGTRQPASAKAMARANASSGSDPLQLPLDRRVSLEASHAVWCESFIVKYSLQQISS